MSTRRGDENGSRPAAAHGMVFRVQEDEDGATTATATVTEASETDGERESPVMTALSGVPASEGVAGGAWMRRAALASRRIPRRPHRQRAHRLRPVPALRWAGRRRSRTGRCRCRGRRRRSC
eukprot:ctg_2551.g350